MAKGFFSNLFGSAESFWDGPKSGKPDPFAAAGMAFGSKDDVSDSDMAELGALLGAAGAFDDDNDDDDDLDVLDDLSDND